MKSCSSFFMPRISEGSFLNQKKQISTQIKPIHPITKKGTRHPYAAAIGTIINGATAAPVFVPISSDDIALLVSAAGNQRETTAELFGNAPDSPMPKKNLANINVINPVVAPVNAVNTDHHITMRIKLARCPILSPIMPEGISNNA